MTLTNQIPPFIVMSESVIAVVCFNTKHFLQIILNIKVYKICILCPTLNILVASVKVLIFRVFSSLKNIIRNSLVSKGVVILQVPIWLFKFSFRMETALICEPITY